MDITFKCPQCNQELEVDAAGAGSEIQCPSCASAIVVPAPDPVNVVVPSAIASSAAAKEEKHFVVPTHETTESLIKKASKPLEIAAKETDRKIRIKTIRRTECQEVGKDHFDEKVTEFLQKIGQENVISINAVNYSAVDMVGHNITDYGVLIVFKG